MTKKLSKYETTANVCCHNVAIRYWDFEAKLTPELEERLTEEGEARAKAMIIDGFHNGELNYLHEGVEGEIRGWWEIKD